MLLEDAGALADVGNRSIPQSTLADRKPERVLRKGCGACSHRCRHEYESKWPRKLSHGRSPCGLVRKSAILSIYWEPKKCPIVRYLVARTELSSRRKFGVDAADLA